MAVLVLDDVDLLEACGAETISKAMQGLGKGLHLVHLLTLVQVMAKDMIDLHPKYARVDGTIETVWQRPALDAKGIVFVAHGCQHQATDIFSNIGPDGWKFDDCATSNLKRCLGLPEEVRLRREARKRGYVVMAVSGGSGRKSCWRPSQDVAKVSKAIEYVRMHEGLPSSMPVFAIGFSSGGALMGSLAASTSLVGLENLKCIIPQIMAIESRRNLNIPTMFVHMPRDEYRASTIQGNIEDLRARKVRVAEIKVNPAPITADLLQECLNYELSQKVLKTLSATSLVDQEGFLKQDARKRLWVKPIQEVLPRGHDDTLVADESCIAELMNVAWAFHEATSQNSTQMLDFCEESGQYAATSKQGSDKPVQKITSGTETIFATSIGNLSVREFGHSDRPLAIALHGLLNADWVVHEWDAVGARLGAIGYHVLIPNLHSNSRTSPKSLEVSDVSSLLFDLVEITGNTRLSLLLGKSWGASMAARVAGRATAPALKIKKLVLVAPAGLKSDDQQVKCKAALFWAEDDPIVSRDDVQTVQNLLKQIVMFHTEPFGGHHVLPAYTDLIAEFASLSTLGLVPGIINSHILTIEGALAGIALIAVLLYVLIAVPRERCVAIMRRKSRKASGTKSKGQVIGRGLE